MNIAVTGGSGHIGANLIRELLAQGHQVKALVHSQRKSFEGLDIQLISGNLHNRAALADLIENTEIVFHLAAQISIGQYSLNHLLKVNVEGTENVIKACKEARVKRLVHFSSIHALNQYPLDKPMTEANGLCLNSQIPYEKTKAIGEDLTIKSSRENGLEVVVINPSAVLGPFDFGPSFLGQFLIRMNNGKIPGIVKGGYNFVDARDVAQGAIKAAQNGINGENYLLTGHWAELPELTSIISELLDKDMHLPMIPDWLARLGVPFLGIWAKIKNEDPLYTRESLKILKTSNREVVHEKATKCFGYNPRPLKITIRDSYTWFKNNGYL